MLRRLALTVALLGICTSAQAQGAFSNDTCIKVYRENTNRLQEITETFNNGRMGRVDYASEVGAISTIVSTHRLGCMIVEDPANRSCVDRYKSIYQALRDRISLSAVLAGNQREIAIPTGLQARVVAADIICRI